MTNFQSRAKKPYHKRTATVRLYEGLSEEHQQAFSDINEGAIYYSGEGGYESGQKLQNGGSRFFELRSHFEKWAKTGISKFNVDAAFAVIYHGRTLSGLDKEYGKKNGYAKDNLLSALQFYHENCRIVGDR